MNYRELGPKEPVQFGDIVSMHYESESELELNHQWIGTEVSKCIELFSRCQNDKETRTIKILRPLSKPPEPASDQKAPEPVSEPLSLADVDRIEAYTAKATPGPWRKCEARHGSCECGQVWSESVDIPVARFLKDFSDSPEMVYATYPPGTMEANADFASQIRTDAPKLCATVRRLLERVEDLEKGIKTATDLLCNSDGCAKHTGENTPPFDEFCAKIQGKCLLCSLEEIESLKLAKSAAEMERDHWRRIADTFREELIRVASQGCEGSFDESCWKIEEMPWDELCGPCKAQSALNKEKGQQ